MRAPPKPGAHRAVRWLGANDLGYTDLAGLIELRANICDYLRAVRSVRCDPEQVVTAMRCGSRTLLSADSRAVGARQGTAACNSSRRPRSVVEAGQRASPRARAAFVTPSHQFPTGVPLSMARRLELLAWARKSGAFIVEDDHTSEFRYSGPPLASLQGLDDTEHDRRAHRRN